MVIQLKKGNGGEMNMSITGVKNTQDWICKFQFFDRNTGQWSSMFAPQIGFGETFVQDETTDDGSLNFKWRSSSKPNIQHMQWARILHFHKGDNMVATYDENGLPINHNQYVIGDFQMAQSKDKSYWLVKLSLLEPIERMRFVVGETLAYTNQTSKTVTDGSGNTVTYVKDPYNHLTALERFLKVTPANCDNYGEGYNPHNNKSWYNRIKILDKDFLQNIPFDSDSFTEPDLYTILFKYDKSTGRTPCMYFDMDPVTDLPRNLDRDEYILKFLRQDGFDKPVLNLSDITANAQNVTYKSSLANFATGVVSNVENLVTGSNTAFPFYKLYAVPEINNNVRNLSNYNTVDSGWGIKFPFPIKRVNKIIRRTALFWENLNSVGNGVISRRISVDDIDLTSNCYEMQEYNSLDEEEYSEDELFYYKEGDNFVYIKNYYCVNNPKLDEIIEPYFYYIEYEPLINPKLEIGDNEYSTIFNQVDSQVDSTKYNKFLNRYLLSMGKSDLTIIKKHYHPEEMYEIGSLVYDEENNKKYMITGSSYQNLNFELLAVYQLNENHFRRNNSVKANKAIRQNASIDYSNIKNRKVSIINNINLNSNSNNNSKFRFIFNSIVNDDLDIPQCVLINASSNLLNSNNENVEMNKKFVLPLLSTANDNEIIFVFCIQDNAMIGKDKYFDDKSYSGAGGVRRYYPITRISKQVDVLYTDPFGCIDIMELDLCSNPQDMTDIEIGNDNVTETTFNMYLDNYKRLACVTISDDEANILKENSIINFGLNILKDSIEKPIISYIVKFNSENIILTNKLLLSSLKKVVFSNLIVKLYTCNVSIYDDIDYIASYQAECSLIDNGVKISFANGIQNVKSLVLWSDNDVLLLAKNVDEDEIYNGYYIISLDC